MYQGYYRKASVNPRFTTCSINLYTHQLSFLGLFKLRYLIMLLFSTTFLTLSCLQFSNPSPSIFGFPLFFPLFLSICVTFSTVNVLSFGIGLFLQKKQVLSRYYYYASRPFTKGVLNHQYAYEALFMNFKPCVIFRFESFVMAHVMNNI